MIFEEDYLKFSYTPFSFTIEWTCEQDNEQPSYINFDVWEAISILDEVPYYAKRGSSDDTEFTNEAYRYLTGTFKWDGTSNMRFFPDDKMGSGYAYFGDVQELKRHGELLKHLYYKAFELMNRKNEAEEW